MFHDTDGVFYCYQPVPFYAPLTLTAATALEIARIVDPDTPYAMASPIHARLATFNDALRTYRMGALTHTRLASDSHPPSSRAQAASAQMQAGLAALAELGITREQAMLAAALQDNGIYHPRELWLAVNAVDAASTRAPI